MENRTLCARVFAVRLLSTTLATSLVVSQTSPVWAQTEMERAGAREAAKEGGTAFAEKRWSAAVDLFTRAESLVHAPPHLLYIARASANMGQLVKARENYLKITREKIPAGAPKAFIEAQTSANKELTELEPRLPSVKAAVSGGEGKIVKVTMDGKEIAAALVGLTMPVDPGDHTFKATADGMASDDMRVSVKEGAKESVALALKPSGAATAGPPPVSAAPPPAVGAVAPAPGPAPAPVTGGPAPATETPAQGSRGTGLRVAGYTVAGVGLLGIGAGALFMASSSSKTKDADALYTQYGCGPTGGGPCTPANQSEVKSLDDKSNSAKTLAMVSFAAGGVAIATGVVLVLVAGGSKNKPAEPATSAKITPVVGLGSIGLVGQF
jgi:hypothetical protein